jgi:hypothetical protein
MTWQRNLGLYYNQQIQEYVKITVWSENKNKNEDFYFSLHFSQQFILALATGRVHQKRFYTEQGEIPLLF